MRADPDQTPRSVASNLGLHCLPKSASPNTKFKYDMYFMVLTSRFDFEHRDTSSGWCLEYIKITADVGPIFADSSFDYPFKHSNI